MTQLLERAFAAASQLPETEQDAVASLLLAELESERRWTESFAASQDPLATLAEEALREFETGETKIISHLWCLGHFLAVTQGSLAEARSGLGYGTSALRA